MTLGVRLSSDEKREVDSYEDFDFTHPYNPATLCYQPCTGQIPGFPDQHQALKWTNFSPLATLQYKFDQHKMVYATFSRGFKSGGYQLGLGGSYDPEKITDYEVGMKADFLDDRLRINAAGFYYDYTNLQIVKIPPNQPTAIILNAAAARLYGAEAEIVAAPTENFRLDVALSAMKSEFTNFITADPARPELGQINLAGNRLPNAPSYTATYGAQYTFKTAAGDFTPRAEGDTTSQVWFDQYSSGTAQAPGYTLWNAFLNYTSPDTHYYASLYVRNLGNLTHLSGAIVGSAYLGYELQSAFIPPRTYGIKFGVKVGKLE